MNAAELRERANYIGSSDVPIILGYSSYNTPKDAWLWKTKRAEPPETTSEPAEFGKAVEPVLVSWAGRRVRRSPRTGVVAHHAEHPFMRAQLDGVFDDPFETIEAKAYGLWNPMWAGLQEWGPDGSDHVPRDVMAQVNFAMACSGAQGAHVVALLGGGLGVRVYFLPRNEALVRVIESACLDFWTQHVLADVAPEGLAGLDVLKYVTREPGKFREVSHDWPDRWTALAEQKKLVEGAVEHAKVSILDEMGDAEEGITPFGKFSFRADKRGRRTFRFHGSATSVPDPDAV